MGFHLLCPRITFALKDDVVTSLQSTAVAWAFSFQTLGGVLAGK